MIRSPNRRAFLGLAFGLLAARVPRLVACTRPAPEEPLHAKLTAALGIDPRAAAIWFAYSLHPPPPSEQHLDTERIARLNIPELRVHLCERIKSDYHAGRITSMCGWYVSYTEAAVLSAIHHRRRAA